MWTATDQSAFFYQCFPGPRLLRLTSPRKTKAVSGKCTSPWVQRDLSLGFGKTWAWCVARGLSAPLRALRSVGRALGILGGFWWTRRFQGLREDAGFGIPQARQPFHSFLPRILLAETCTVPPPPQLGMLPALKLHLFSQIASDALWEHLPGLTPFRELEVWSLLWGLG